MDGVKKIVRDLFKKYPQVKVAYIFGSQARGIASSLSDVDIAVLLDEDLDSAQYLDLQLSLMADFSEALGRDDVDVVVLNPASLILCHQVLKHGRLIYCADERVRFRFTYEANRDYLDTGHMYKVQGEYLRRRIKEGKFGDRRGDYTAALAEARRVFGQTP
ncbi:MAG: nucleotidyltransferase domain-containing protein [Anaerolineae bacterium]